MIDDRTPASALAVYAHPDDPEIAAGGTLARWAGAGADVWILVTTMGDKGSDDPDCDTVALAARRARESAAAAEVIGARGAFGLDFPDGDLIDDRPLRAAIVRHIRELKPEVVLCPDPTAVFFGDRYVNHRDHRITGWATLDAVSPAAANPHYFPEQIADGLTAHQVRALYCSGTLAPDVWVDIGAHIETKFDALFQHTSQLVDVSDEFRAFLRDRAVHDGRTAGLEYAEGFRRIQFGD